jgi:hypothetical protein
MPAFDGHNPVNCGKPLKHSLPTCRGNTGEGQTNSGDGKKENDLLLGQNGQSAAKHPGNRVKVQRLLGVIYRMFLPLWRGYHEETGTSAGVGFVNEPDKR